MNEEKERTESLVNELKNGNEGAFEELYRLTSPRAYFIALQICKNEHDAEDILQESYIKAIQKTDEIDPQKSFTAWFYKIVANKSKNLVKSKKPTLFSEDEEKIIGDLPDENLDFSPEENADREELRREVMAAVDELTAEKRACVMMMYFGEMSVKEIAESLEVPVSTVKNRLFAARKDLKNKFEKNGVTALYSAAPLGALIWALRLTSDMVASKFAAGAASALILSNASAAVSAKATAIGSAASATGATSSAFAASTGVISKIAALSVAQKIVAGLAVTAVVSGSTVGVITAAKSIRENSATNPHIETHTTAPHENAVIIIDGELTETTDLSAEQNSDISQTNESVITELKPLSSTQTATAKPTETATSNTTTTKPAATTTTQPSTTEPETTTTTQPSTTEPETTTTTQPSTTEPETTTTTQPSTTEPETTTTTQPSTTEPTTQAPATVNVEVIDMNEDVVATFSLSVEAGTEMTWEYLVSQIKSKGYEPQAGIYGDAVDAVAESGKTYSITAEL